MANICFSSFLAKGAGGRSILPHPRFCQLCKPFLNQEGKLCQPNYYSPQIQYQRSLKRVGIQFWAILQIFKNIVAYALKCYILDVSLKTLTQKSRFCLGFFLFGFVTEFFYVPDFFYVFHKNIEKVRDIENFCNINKFRKNQGKNNRVQHFLC